MEQAGEVRFDFYYNGNKQTHADCLVINNTADLIRKRVDFIRTRQQMNNPSDLRDGAYMVYDNEGDSIYLNDRPNCNPVDRDEGAERLGMGVLLAKQYLLTKDPELKQSLLRYANFVRRKLQTDNYVTYSSVDQKNRNRGYNYMWVAEPYFQMYKVTGDKQFVTDGYKTPEIYVPAVWLWLLCNRHSCSVGTAKPERSRNEERIHGFAERFYKDR